MWAIILKSVTSKRTRKITLHSISDFWRAFLIAHLPDLPMRFHLQRRPIVFVILVPLSTAVLFKKKNNKKKTNEFIDNGKWIIVRLGSWSWILWQWMSVANWGRLTCWTIKRNEICWINSLCKTNWIIEGHVRSRGHCICVVQLLVVKTQLNGFVHRSANCKIDR